MAPKSKGMNVAQITDAMTKVMDRTEHVFPRALVIPCDCPQTVKTVAVKREDGGTDLVSKLTSPHMNHGALPMAVPVAVACNVTIGGVKIVRTGA